MDETFREVIFTWDTNDMAKRMCMSKRFIDEFMGKANGFAFMNQACKLFEKLCRTAK